MHKNSKFANEYRSFVGDAEFVFIVGNLSAIIPDRSDYNENLISHSHLHDELIYVVNGKIEIHTEECTLFLNKGDIALIPANLVHNTDSNELTHFVSMGYIVKKRRIKTASSYADTFLNLRKNKVIKIEDFDKFHCFDRIAFYQRSGYTDSDQLIISCLLEIIFLVKNALLEKDTAKISITTKFDEYQYSFIDQYISQNYNKTPSLTELSNQTYMSTQQLQRIIKKLYHQSFAERILFLKIENAKRLLKNTKKPVEQIALTVGYESPKSFFKAFKNIIGISPGQYRKKHLAQND